LAAQQAEDRVPDDKAAADPPLLRQETEACHAYLSVLLHINRVGSSSSSSSSRLKELLGEVEQLCQVRGKKSGRGLQKKTCLIEHTDSVCQIVNNCLSTGC
jgi:hypothetical protein